MSPVTKPKRTMTLEEFHKWDSGDGLRYELIDGVPVAMTSPANAHGTIVAKLARRIGESLDARPPCRVMVEVGIVSPTRADTWYQADLAVSCKRQPPDQHSITEPILIVEVLSPSTENQDRKVKLVDYRSIPSVQEVLLVDSTRRYCELLRRLDDNRWLTELAVDPDAVLRLESIDCDLRLSDIYSNVELEQDKQPEQATPETQAATE
jgi:Uma2 family endonuclease